MNQSFCRTTSLHFVVSTFLLSFACATLANAAIIGSPEPPTIVITSQASTDDYEFAPVLDEFVTSSPADTSYELETPEVSRQELNGTTDITVDEFEFDPDPFVLNNIIVTNTSAVTQAYSVSVLLPTAFGAPNVINGSIAVSLIDGGTNGATLTTVAGLPIYQAQIDFATVASMLAPPFTLTATPSLPGAIVSTFGPTLNAVPVTATIGILLNFSLTAGDTASILSRFDVVPEPATLLIAACGGIGMIVVARRQAVGRA